MILWSHCHKNGGAKEHLDSRKPLTVDEEGSSIENEDGKLEGELY